MNFDAQMDQRGSGSSKWDGVASMLGHDDPGALAMWLAQMDFAPGEFLTRAAQATVDRGQWGYFVGLERMFERVAWWAETRWGWPADPSHMRATHGLGNAIGICLQTWSNPGDEVIIFSPVYNEFAAKVQKNGRTPRQSPLSVDDDGRFQFDLEELEKSLSGREKIMLISQPHNPAGRIWSVAEMQAMAEFCARHDLIFISDEIHADLVFPGKAHVPAGTAVTEFLDRTIILTAASKTFDIAGLRTGTVIIPDATRRAEFDRLHRALDIQPNRMGVELTKAAYSEAGAAWVDGLQAYLAENARVLSDGLSSIPGVTVLPMEATYLAWVDFAGTGMDRAELDERTMKTARVVPSPGPIFGIGGEMCQRINIGTCRANIEDAVARLRAAFADLQ